jgi:hypothetical protein
LVFKQVGNAVGQRETILDLPFTHSLPSRALPDGPIHQPQAFRNWLDVLQFPSWERHLGRRSGSSRSSRASSMRRRAGGGWLHEIKYDGYRMHARIVGPASNY